MVFASLSFLFFIFPLFLVLDFIFRKTNIIRNICLISVSLFFYIFDGGFHSLKILLAFGILNFVFGYILQSIKENKSFLYSKYSLFSFVSINILALVFYKYSYWLISLLQGVGVAESIKAKQQILPLGISFFTFHAISYLVDIYKGEVNGKNNPIKFLTYFFMFPHLIAGPIVRYKQVSHDLGQRSIDHDLFNYGLYRFILGFNKKILIANSVAPFANMAFLYNVESLSTVDAWIGALAYTLQIYFDFSAYSDMAIGLAAMAGFRFSENFNQPYRSTSIKEFWRRWHISLSSWLRDYVYIPLGGSRCSKRKTYVNLIFVFFLCGIWHGANLTFVIWGLYNGLFLVLERLFLGKILSKVPRFLTHIYAFLVVVIGWVFFRAESLSDALNYLQVMFDFSRITVNPICEGKFINYLAFITGLMIIFVKTRMFDSSNSKECITNNTAYFIQFILMFASVATLYFGAQNPFIYFNF